ncbi:MAG: outer spore coat protein CotE [Desulfotomaculaceae bacterium]
MSEAIGAEKRNCNCPRGAYREIITKAICGTVSKTLQYTHFINLPEGVIADQILGCTLTHQRLNEPKMKDASSNSITIIAAGVYVVQIWYAYNDGRDTDVLRSSINFKEFIPIEYYDGQNANPLVAKAAFVTPPQILESSFTNDNRIKLDVQLDIVAEIIGESKILVSIFQPDRNV